MNDPHPDETHKSQRSNWLRAAILGADDGIVSTSSIMLGVIAAGASPHIVITTGIASLAAGAISMAAGEYVSVSSQRDAEHADIAIEERALKNNPEGELLELAAIYEGRGLTKELAHEVAVQLQSQDAVEAHARDELGISSRMRAHPMQAALASLFACALGAAVPLIVIIVSGTHNPLPMVILSLLFLGLSGVAGAAIGGGSKTRAGLRVFIGGGLAMAVTWYVGHLLGVNL